MINSNNNDPFFNISSDEDNTVIRPIPGGRAQDLQRRSVVNTTISTVSLEHLSKLNPLVTAASTLLDLIANLYGRPSHSAAQQLRQQLSNEVKHFQQQATQVGINQQTMQLASHALCTTLDEAVFNTPWGQEIGWARHGLLSQFHHSVAGGEEFFQNLRKLGDHPAQNLSLLELMYLCLSLGFKGRYQLVEDGKAKLEQIQTWLIERIRQQRGTSESLLSPHWVGVEAKNRTIKRFMPLWGYYALATALAVIVFAGLFISLGAYGSTIKQKINEIAFAPSSRASTVSSVAPSLRNTLSQFLAPEIQTKLVTVGTNKNGKVFIRLRGEQGLFKSGSEQLLVERQALIDKIADTLMAPNVAINSLTTVGYTDDVQLNNRLRFNDNFELSKARAESVRSLLLERQPKLSITVRGGGSLDSVGDNQTPEGRSANRRVEIILD